MTKELLSYELELLILEAISNHGISVLPTNYKFLKRYGLMELYFNYVESSRLNIPSVQFDSAIKRQASNYVPNIVSHKLLISHYQQCGLQGLIDLLEENGFFFEANPINQVSASNSSPEILLEEILKSYIE